MRVKFMSHLLSNYPFFTTLRSLILTILFRQSDACDVVNFEEYADVVKKILAGKKDLQNGKKSVTILVDTASVEKAAKKVRTCTSLLLMHS